MSSSDTAKTDNHAMDWVAVQAALDGFPFAIYMMEESMQFVYANHAAVQYLGYTREELLTMGPKDIDKHIPEVFGEYARAAKPGAVFSFDTKHQRKDGTELQVNVTGVMVENQGRQLNMVVVQDMSDQIALRTQLDMRDIYLRALLNNFPFVVWVKDTNSRLSAVNDAYAKMMGKTSALEFEGKTEFDFLPHEQAAAYREEDQRVMQSGQHSLTEVCLSDEQGNPVWWEGWKAPVRFDGKTVGTLGFSRNVTERKKMEIRLQESLALLEGVIQAFPDFVFEVNQEGRFLNAWIQHTELRRQTQESVIGKTVHDLFTPDNASLAMSAMAQAKTLGLSLGTVLQFESPKGTRWFELSVSRMPKANGDLHFIAVSRNVTQRMHMQASLMQQEREFRTLVENSPDMVARFDAQKFCRYANPSLLRLLGRSEDRIQGASPQVLWRGDAGQHMTNQLHNAIESRQQVEFEFICANGQGQEVVSLVSLTPEFDAADKVSSVLMIGRDISELRAYQDKIHLMAFYDALTGQPNRVLFNDRLQQMIADAAYHDQRAGVMMVDLDRFKHVNDTMGHAAGDALLIQVTNRLSECIRTYDTVARMGGDEFGILLPRIRSGEHLGRVAAKVLDIFRQPFMLEGKEIFVTGSVGIAVYPQDSKVADELVRFADSAMYYAKRAGRNGFCFYSSDMTDTARQRLSLEIDLRRALERNEFFVQYQPKVELHSGRVMGCEALLRWKHPTRGMVPPVQFIPIAEDAGLIGEIGLWVLREACKTAAIWNAGSDVPRKVAVNLSPRQLHQAGWVDQVKQVLQETQCKPQWLECEITEGLLLDEDERNIQILQSLRVMGITIAIDDFGTGYSALGYLSRFPIDTLKIDRSFIQSVNVDTYRAELVRAILSIARCLHQEVVAEGVETMEQASFLLAQGCPMVQGYLFSKPISQSDLLGLPVTITPAA